MSFWGKIFGTDKALTSIVDGVKNGLDALVYTDQEKADDASQDRSEARKMVIQWMAATQGQNLARRLIALSITGVWLLQYVISQIVSVISIFMDKPGDLQKVSEVMKSGAGDMGPAVMLILAFYFAAPHMGDIAKAVTGRFTKNLDKKD
ncbi:MAG: hypothetical protein JKY53_00120 [Flavobacteriales bacterium]|nr:hypothetical protein [Flavobacteriales bacterium]